ncbi:MAG TPA: hypothetical protein VN737_20100 [Bryobacteraceae bacterium]|jgi:hypothetical protein|nr:hypothetical protein [Bryobacteraceae bacterium]
MGTNGNTPLSEQATVHLAGPEDTRLRFSGPPKSLTGTLPLVNTGPEKQKIRSVAVNSDKLLGAARLPLREIPFYARLYGGEQVSVPATLVLDPQTPPGSYDLEFTVGMRTLAATAYVSEVVDLRLDPVQITILVGSATSYTRTLVVENAGNVALPTGSHCEAPIFDSFDLVSTFLVGLNKGDRQSAESMAKAFLNEWADLKAGTLITKRKAMVLAPGQKLAVDIEFQLPGDLKPLRHYRANLQLYNATLSVDIYTTAKTGSGAKAPKVNREASVNE